MTSASSTPVPSVTGTNRQSRWVLAATMVLSTWIAVAARWGPDWPAQEFRAGLARTGALLFWDNNWYAGQALAGYSALYPPIAGLVGAALAGAVATVLLVWAAMRLLPDRGTWHHTAMSVATTLAAAGLLLIGQVPFLLGASVGLLAILAWRRHRPIVAAVLAATCSLFSPLAGGFLLLGGVALTAAGGGWRRALPLLAALTGPAVAMVLGGASGPMLYPWTSLACVAIFCAAAVLLTPRDGSVYQRGLYRVIGVYAAAGLTSFVIPNPIGGNIARFGQLVAMPLACYALARTDRRRIVPTAMAAVSAVVWVTLPVASSIASGAGDPSQRATYYQGLLGFLRHQDPALGRVEIPFTHDHWEAVWVAKAFPIARGWERQSDLLYNQVLYQPITAAAYRRWLNDTAVRFVALPDVPLDRGGTAEGALLKHPPSYLQSVWRDAHWQVWRVRDATPLAVGPARMTDLDASSFRLRFTTAGTVVVHIRASRLWRITAGHGCVGSTPQGWLRVTRPDPGSVVVSAGVNTTMFGSADGLRCAS